jgi:hypothetical protein
MIRLAITAIIFGKRSAWAGEAYVNPDSLAGGAGNPELPFTALDSFFHAL